MDGPRPAGLLLPLEAVRPAGAPGLQRGGPPGPRPGRAPGARRRGAQRRRRGPRGGGPGLPRGGPQERRAAGRAPGARRRGGRQGRRAPRGRRRRARRRPGAGGGPWEGRALRPHPRASPPPHSPPPPPPTYSAPPPSPQGREKGVVMGVRAVGCKPLLYPRTCAPGRGGGHVEGRAP